MKKYLGILPMVMLMACNGSDHSSAGKKDTVAKEVQAAASVKFKDPKIEPIFSNYLQLKNALVAGKEAESKAAAKALAPALQRFSGCENTAVIARHIAEAKDLVRQRKEFTALSNDIIALLKHTELTTGTLYVQHCPMANSGDGGDWIAAERKIQNPYYGAEMLECGAVVSEIKAK